VRLLVRGIMDLEFPLLRVKQISPWAGDTEVTEIWISLDGGASWVQGDFVDPISRHAWRRWKYDWITPAQPGRYTLLARATGADQRAQPDGHNPNFGSYVIDHPLPIEVFVAAL
jgi:hypothetical protein